MLVEYNPIISCVYGISHRYLKKNKKLKKKKEEEEEENTRNSRG
jgi:hypothetical protein